MGIGGLKVCEGGNIAPQGHDKKGKSEQFCVFGWSWHLDNQYPEDCSALVHPSVRDFCRALDQHIFCTGCAFVANLDDAGAFQYIEKDVDWRDVLF
jgi:hypothetical protein